jgi:hypothetical protein
MCGVETAGILFPVNTVEQPEEEWQTIKGKIGDPIK